MEITATPAIVLTAASEPDAHTPRTTKPAAPRLLGTMEREAIERIRAASEWEPHLALMEISNVRTINQNPAIAIYKTEMMEYLVGLG